MLIRPELIDRLAETLEGIAMTHASPGDRASREASVLVKKYGNRRLYDTARSRYLTLEDLAEIIRKARTKSRKGTSGKQKRDSQSLPLKLSRGDGLPKLIGETIFGKRLPDLQRFSGANELSRRRIGRCRGRRGTKRLDLIDPSFGIRHRQAKGNGLFRR